MITITTTVDPEIIANEANAINEEAAETPDSVVAWIEVNPQRIKSLVEEAIIAELSD